MYLKTPLPCTRSANIHHLVKSVGTLLALLFCTPLFAQTHVTMQLRWTHQFQFAGYYAALQQGFYKDAGLDVTLKEGGPSISPINEVLAGRADFGVSTSGLVKAYLDGKPILMLAPIIQHSPQVLLSIGTKLTNPADIAKAGPISLQPGDECTDLKAIFINEGISLDKLKITSGANLDDLVHGKIVAMNAYISNETFWLKKHGIAYSTVKPESYGMDFYSDVLFTNQSMEKTHPETVAAFRTATLKGWEYALSHQDEIIDLILTHYNPQEKSREQLDFEAKTIKDLITPELVQIGYSNPGRWSQIAKTFERFEIIKSDKSLDGFFYQTDKKQDLTKLYYGLGIALVIITIISSISFYIYSINRRLRRAAIEQAEVEDLLRKNEQRYRIFFETSPSVGLVWTDGFIVTDWNHHAEEVFGFKRDEVLGQNFFDFLIPDTEKSALQADMAGMTQFNTRHHATNTNLTSDGQILTVEWFNAWLPKISGHPQEILSLGLDITERFKSEKKLAQAMANLEKAEADQRILVSVASHEFRTPAAMIKTSLDSLDILKDQISPDVAIRLENIAKASLRLNRLANNLISFDRLQELALKPKMQTLDIGLLAGDVVSHYPENYAMTLHLPTAPLLLEGDSILLSIALHNLIDNAFRHQKNTSIPVAVTVVQVHESGNDWIELSVADQGPGLPDIEKEIVFQRFYSSKDEKSAGLGLSIVRSVAQAHGGTAFIVDNQPQGAVFVIRLSPQVNSYPA